MTWLDIIQWALNVVLAGGFITTLITLRASKRTAEAQAGMTEVDLKKAMMELEALADEATSKQIRGYLEELQELRPKIAAALAENTRLVEKCAELDLKVIEWMKRALIAEKRAENAPPCSIIECGQRIPPLAPTGV